MFGWIWDLTARGAAHHDRVFWRLVAGCAGCANLFICDPIAAGTVAHFHRRGGECLRRSRCWCRRSAAGSQGASGGPDRRGSGFADRRFFGVALFTFLLGFAQDFNQLFVLRALQGLGFGGEWAAGAVLMGEVIRDQYRGRAVGLVQTGWAVGWGIAALLFTLFSRRLMPEATAWRAMFWIGLAPAVAGILDPPLRRGTGTLGRASRNRSVGGISSPR